MDIDKIYNKLGQKISKENIYKQEPMTKHTSFKVGGPADIFVIPTTKEEILYILKLVKEENIPITIIGNGSNLLVKDNGIRGIVVKPNIKYIEKEENSFGAIFTVGASVPLTLIARKALEDSLTGLEFACGIPGTLGGGILTNAGAHGGELKDVVIETTYIDYDGNVNKIDNNAHEFEYRGSKFSRMNTVILESKLKFENGDKKEIEAKMKENMEKRKASQPIELPSAGSVFKREEEFITAKVIDEMGLKGYSIGGAEVSKKHAGFIVNKGGATAKDILDLITYIKDKVKKVTGKEIQLEIRVVGE